MTRLTLLALALGTTALPALAADQVNVYSHRQPELIQPLVDAFTKETGIPVNVAFVDKGMVERLQAEGDRSPADVVLTVDISRLSEIVNSGVAQPVESDVLKANIPAEFRDPGNQWFGLTSRARIVYASKERVKDGEVTTYEDLADPKWKGRICTRSGVHDYNLALLSAYIVHHGTEAAKGWAEGIRSNLAFKPQGGDRDQAKAIWAGQCDIALGNTYYMGLMVKDPKQKEWADSVRVVFPKFEDGGTHMNISGMAMTKSAPNKEAALKFMEFLASDEAQRIYAEANNEFPIEPGIPVSEVVASWGTFTADNIPLVDVAKERPEALKIMEQVDFDS